MKREILKLILIQVLIVALLFVHFFYLQKNTIQEQTYQTVKHDNNYEGIGQQEVSNQENYYTIFTTIKKNQKTYKEYKQNQAKYATEPYWNGTMAENGCGITAMAIILSGYGYDDDPGNLREKYYPLLQGTDMSSELQNTYGIENSDFYYDSYHLSNLQLLEHLNSNRPILICVYSENGENRWTTLSHYMVLLACDDQNNVYVSNPNGLKNDNKESGWYSIDEITPYLAKAMYIYSYN